MVILASALAACAPSSLGHEEPLATLYSRRAVRQVEGRVHLANTWRPYVASHAVGADVAPMLAAHAAVRRALADRRAPDTLLAVGVAEILDGDATTAGALLSEALSLSPADHRLWNDVAVALLAEPAGGSIESTARAFEAAAVAGKLAPDDAAPIFNSALAGSRLGLQAFVDSQWTRLMQVEKDPGWVSEIQARASRTTRRRSPTLLDTVSTLRRLSLDDPMSLHALVIADPQGVREAAFEFLLPEWGRDFQQGDIPRARESARRLAALAKILLDRHADPLLADSLRLLDGPAGTVQDLAAGVSRYGEGRRLQRAADFERGRLHLAAAVDRLLSIASPFAAVAQADLGLAIYQTDGPRAAIPVLIAANDTARARRYVSLVARTDWLMALSWVGLPDPGRASAAYDRAIAGYEATGEIANLCSVLRASADLLRTQGEWDRGWPRLTLALRCMERDSDPLRRYLTYFEASLYAADADLPYLALAFQDAAIREANVRGVDATIAEAHIRRARLHARVGDAESARRDLRQGASASGRITSAAMAAYQRAWAARVEGEMALRTAPERVAQILDAGIVNLFEAIEPSEVPRILLLRGKAMVRLGALREAEQHFLLGLELVEQRLHRLEEDDQKLSYLDAEWDLLGALIQLNFNRRDFSRALSYAHRRARGEQASFSGRCADFSPDVTAFAYVALAEELLMFRCRGGEMSVRRAAESATSFERRVRSYRRLLLVSGNDPERDAAGSALYEMLFGWARPDQGARLVILPDGITGLVPYAALVNGQTKRYMVEEHEIALLAVVDPPPSRPKRSMPAEIVVVAPGQGRPLPRAMSEGTLVAAGYRVPVLLTGSNATIGQLRDSARRASILHFAGHARANPSLPWASYLLLSPDSGRDDGRLGAEEIASWSLEHVDLVVLSACESVAARNFRGDSLVGLAKAFLRGGAKTVVGSLWEVEDDAASELMLRFHRASRDGQRASAALRAAQLDLLTGTDPSYRSPRSWSGFAAITSSPSLTRSK